MNNEIRSAQSIIEDARLSHKLNLEVRKAQYEKSCALKDLCKQQDWTWTGGIEA